jgi:hypothetical protein
MHDIFLRLQRRQVAAPYVAGATISTSSGRSVVFYVISPWAYLSRKIGLASVDGGRLHASSQLVAAS